MYLISIIFHTFNVCIARPRAQILPSNIHTSTCKEKAQIKQNKINYVKCKYRNYKRNTNSSRYNMVFIKRLFSAYTRPHPQASFLIIFIPCPFYLFHFFQICPKQWLICNYILPNGFSLELWFSIFANGDKANFPIVMADIGYSLMQHMQDFSKRKW